ncbi:MAG: dienelactone hydrolase family protein [Clostridia bacterium]|nr:dienelactone hydrolase family protein [Clostridia bacterium]
MIVSAVSLWKKLDMSNPLAESEWGAWAEENAVFTHVTYSGHKAADGSVRVYAVFGKPAQGDKFPTILLLPDGGKRYDTELMRFFISRGYAVLMPDYSGKMKSDEENTPRTIYPKSLEFANFDIARGLDDLDDLKIEESCWFEWLYVATYSIEYLKKRADVASIGVVGIRLGGEIAWKAMLSPDLKCGVPVNAVGWRSYKGVNKFSDNAEKYMRDSKHRYIAGVDSQSYASFVKCPVLMLCALRDECYDPDRAYDTYCRIGVTEGSAISYSLEGGTCIGSKVLGNLDLFLGKHLKGREIYIPSALNISMKEAGDKLEIFVEGDSEAILSELRVYYSEAELGTKAVFRDWRRVEVVDGKAVKEGKYVFSITPDSKQAGAFVYVSAKYFNGFRIASKIIGKKLSGTEKTAKNKLLYGGKRLDTFCVAENKKYSIGEIFLEQEALPKKEVGYGGISGAYSVGGIKTYKISSPTYLPEENSLLKFDVYSEQGVRLIVTVDVATSGKFEKYRCKVSIKAGGKWKRIVLKPDDFKNESEGTNLSSFLQGKALSFESKNEEDKFSVTNIIWL